MAQDDPNAICNLTAKLRVLPDLSVIAHINNVELTMRQTKEIIDIPNKIVKTYQKEECIENQLAWIDHTCLLLHQNIQPMGDC